MSGLDDLFREEASIPSATKRGDQAFNKEAWVQKKQELRQWTYDTIDTASLQIAQSGEGFQQYLDVQSRFDRYSVANALLILAQRPEATRIADFEGWKEQGVFIRRKETGFYILEPGESYKREDGSTAISYNPKRMFDISQTTALPKQEQNVMPDERAKIKALIERAPVPITMSDSLPSEMHALYQPDTRSIVIRRGLAAGDIFRALTQELAHAEMDKGNGQYARSESSLQAYCAAYMLSKQFGFSTSSFSFQRVPELLGKMEPQQLRKELTYMKEAAQPSIVRMNRQLSQQQRQAKRSEPTR
ncbi:hypothetical protein GCM10008014_49880 [Paenibacillus silvae]|uniref:LtrC-like protein n=1 Tax=Paenibacillus silvae TaxID=1325358 RepID=A0ABQ1ZL61_9BACL|nr:hypothetical protein [Paenibacillus silvae]GGH67924.1 hypothetical protein GCM10008014_49880 [Paenibacillus silvae]